MMINKAKQLSFFKYSQDDSFCHFEKFVVRAATIALNIGKKYNSNTCTWISHMIYMVTTTSKKVLDQYIHTSQHFFSFWNTVQCIASYSQLFKWNVGHHMCEVLRPTSSTTFKLQTPLKLKAIEFKGIYGSQLLLLHMYILTHSGIKF